MSDGFANWPLFRVTPLDGPAFTIDVRQAIPSTVIGGPIRIRRRVTPDLVNRRTINRTRKQLFRGWSVQVAMTFVFLGDEIEMSECRVLSQIVDALQEVQSGTIVELSLDYGNTYRAVLLQDLNGPDQLEGKTIGMQWVLTVETVDLVERIVPVTDVITGPAESVPCAW